MDVEKPGKDRFLKIVAVQHAPAFKDRERTAVQDQTDINLHLYDAERRRLDRSRRLARLKGFWYGRDWSLSPDQQWFYLASHADTITVHIPSAKVFWLGRYNEPNNPGMKIYHLKWSWDSRYLVGQKGGALDHEHLILCTPGKYGYRKLVRDNVLDYGWYPDSRSVWYIVRKGEREQYFRIRIPSGKSERLSPAEVERIQHDWDFRPQTAVIRGEEYECYYYTADAQMRALCPRDYRKRETSPVIIQKRDEDFPRELALPRWIRYAFVADVSADKQWALVISGSGLYSLVHLETNRWEHLFHTDEVSWLRLRLAESIRFERTLHDVAEQK